MLKLNHFLIHLGIKHLKTTLLCNQTHRRIVIRSQHIEIIYPSLSLEMIIGMLLESMKRRTVAMEQYAKTMYNQILEVFQGHLKLPERVKRKLSNNLNRESMSLSFNLQMAQRSSNELGSGISLNFLCC